jgi:hypothetical protein
VNEGAAQAWFIAGTVPLILAGGAHLLGAIRDSARPTYFTPIDASVRTATEKTGIELVRMFGGSGARPSMWRVWLGVHMTHGLGILSVGLFLLLLASYDFDLVERVDAVRPLAIFFSAGLFAISLRFFFRGPILITGASTACFVVATALSA